MQRFGEFYALISELKSFKILHYISVCRSVCIPVKFQSCRCIILCILIGFVSNVDHSAVIWRILVIISLHMKFILCPISELKSFKISHHIRVEVSLYFSHFIVFDVFPKKKHETFSFFLQNNLEGDKGFLPFR